MTAFEAGREELARKGLNIFASAKVRDLPEDILVHFKKIPYSADDSIVVLGHGGRTLWENLPQPLDEDQHPVDSFSLQQMQGFARTALEGDARILFPDSRYILPLQKLGRALNISRPSALGIDISDTFGVWFAFRGVFLTSQKIPEVRAQDFTSPCDTCINRTCQEACPVAAVGHQAPDFNLSACASHRLTPNSNCADRCLARIACSYRPEHRYSLEQIQYHMGRRAHLARLTKEVKVR